MYDESISQKNQIIVLITFPLQHNISIILTLGLIASAFLLDYYNHIESTIISLTLWIVSLCMIPAIDIHSSNLRRKKHEKNYLSGMH